MIRRPRERFGPAAVVLVVALLLLVGTGTWPPLVAVESGSMEPSVERGDLVVVTAVDRFPWDGPVGSDAVDPPTKLDGTGDVVVFTSPIDPSRPILHRVAFRVTAGEDWTDRADPDRLDGADCVDIAACPAPYDGYVTYGDANGEYDQSAGIAPIVHEELIHAKALFSVPYLGFPQLAVDAAVGRFGVVPAGVGIVAVVSLVSGTGAFLVGWARDGWRGRVDRRSRDDR
ncbi:S26 family signal peptidase [Halorubrum sp. 48-1-W]|uniref:S26 family signal peptidase n=1 Tax=Halorubrum sp. 48-1-W TaxID=2249761 RepID=UPI000DCBEB92|nr:S26 family signal peptidase [Halorubrum sp. 48-1-W]RAW45674.1 S26 family signal peptidase [Halorubrum sp. 48-1-W]